ncbi:MAG: type II toxin-antitoxin system VapC family toxin [Ferruginibacter sp.]|nr:type II toxin-antitoxin system VapC family toxin [Rhodoferax sp.]
MKRYLLDTNTVSHLLKRHPAVVQRVVAVPMAALCISAITEGELLFGLAKRPDANRVQVAVRELLLRLDVLPWDRAAAACYGLLRATLADLGKPLAPLDLLIAAHGLSVDAVVVTNDQAFRYVPGMQLEDWTL